MFLLITKTSVYKWNIFFHPLLINGKCANSHWMCIQRSQNQPNFITEGRNLQDFLFNRALQDIWSPIIILLEILEYCLAYWPKYQIIPGKIFHWLFSVSLDSFTALLLKECNAHVKGPASAFPHAERTPLMSVEIQASAKEIMLKTSPFIVLRILLCLKEFSQ